MFNDKALIFDFPLIRILTILAIDQNPEDALEITDNIHKNLHLNVSISAELKEKYLSKVIWDRCNILILMEKHN